ncbi:MAG: DNA gyrase inhibitor YacG [Alphaproteobacteria bacterium HGW-Alphaproteobacteria-2]|nr:MAG: DNA gyrase inhibitor YacG [Alphaproteobacteria bacterium HGW-Alphaproteobacteria-2]
MRCPVCSKPAVARYRPFCSRRCADVDLGRWLTGAHVVATEETPGEDDAPPGNDDATPRD